MSQRSRNQELFKVRLYREDLSFSAGHISTYDGQLEGHHGHNYRISIEFEGTVDGRDSLVVDFRTVKNILRDIINRLNHRTLVPSHHPHLLIEKGEKSTSISLKDDRIELPTNSLVFLELPNLTSEMLAYYVFQSVKERLSAADRERIQRMVVEIIESPGQSASYSGRF